MYGLRALNPVAKGFVTCGRTHSTLRTSLAGRSRLHPGFLYRLATPHPTPLAKQLGSIRTYSTPVPTSPTPKRSLWSRMFSVTAKDNQTASSFSKIVALAKPERKPLTFAVGLLLISSSVSMSIPFTVGKLIDYFTSADPVCSHHVITLPGSLEGNFQQIPYGLTLGQAAGILFAAFTIGALANTGRAILMRMAGQRIVARLRERTYVAALKQEVEFVERGEGDVLSRLSVDSSIVGERYGGIPHSVNHYSSHSASVTQNLSDGLRAVVMASAGRTQTKFTVLSISHDPVFFSSWRDVLCFPCPHNLDACACPSRLVRCCRSTSSFFRVCLTSTRFSMAVTLRSCQIKHRKPSVK